MGYGESSVVTINVSTRKIMYDLMQRQLAGNVESYDLFGDSITEGVGATSHTVPADNPVIFNDGAGTLFREGCYTCKCWANAFRNHINANYPGVTVTNRGIGGKSMKWANQNKQHLVPNQGDVAFVMYGTNDRQGIPNAAELEANAIEFLAYVNSRYKTMIVMTAPPTLNDYDSTGTRNPAYNFDMGVVDRVITKVCDRFGYAHISHYRLMLDYSRNSKTPLRSLLQGYQYGSHPIDKGYEVMWHNIQQQLGMIEKVTQWEDMSDKAIIIDANTVTPTTAITASVFGSPGLVTVADIGGSHPNIGSFPSGMPGTLTTYRATANDLYSYQTYAIRGSNIIYRRTWDNGGSVWRAWELMSAFMTVSALPTAGALYRGIDCLLLGGAGVADQKYTCRKKADGTYEWLQLTT